VVGPNATGSVRPRRSEHGADYGLCQIYGNEPWHYELRPEATDHGCPPMYADPTQDPRMQPV
jgi:D-alanyl-D-alanine carboxypeptidase